MRRFSILFIVLGLISISSVPSRAQRALGAHNFVLDDGSGNTLTLRYLNTPPVSGNSFLTFLPGSGASTPIGTANNSTLRWDAGSGTWQENLKFTATSAGAISAGSSNQFGVDISGNASTTGDFKTGSTLQYTGSSGVERLILIRGYFDASGHIISGSDYSVVRNSTGDYTVTVPDAVIAFPSFTATAFQNGGGNYPHTVELYSMVSGVLGTKFYLNVFDKTGLPVDEQVSFIIMAPR
jgi:hypothetical protein